MNGSSSLSLIASLSERSPALRIVVVDADPQARSAAGQALTRCGHQTVSFPDVERSVRHFARNPVDLILLEVPPDRQSALSLLVHLRRRGVNVPVVVTTKASALEETRQRTHGLSVVILTKPFTPEELQAAIREACESGAAVPVLISRVGVRGGSEGPFERFDTHLSQLMAEDAFPRLDERFQLLHEIISGSRSCREMEEAVSTDPRLVALVLRRVNSSRFRGATPTRSLREAIVRLGEREVAALALQVTVRGAFQIRRPWLQELLERYWASHLACADHCHVIGLRMGGISADELRLSGLLHNVGELMVLFALDQLEGLSTADQDLAEGIVAARHEDVGRILLTKWQLSRDLISVAGFHHHPPDQQSPIANMVRLGWHITMAEQSSQPLTDDPSVLELCDHLGVTNLSALTRQ